MQSITKSRRVDEVCFSVQENFTVWLLIHISYCRLAMHGYGAEIHSVQCDEAVSPLKTHPSHKRNWISSPLRIVDNNNITAWESFL